MANSSLRGKSLILCQFLAVVCSGQCQYEDTPTGPGSSIVYETRNGRYVPPHGVVRALVVLVELDYPDPATQDPTGPNGTQEWPAHSFPEWVDNLDPSENLFDHDVPVGQPQGLLTRYFHEASSGNFTFLADYLVPPGGGIFHVPTTAGGGTNNSTTLAAVNTAMGGTLSTYYGHETMAELDMWILDGPTTGPGEPKIFATTEDMYDHVVIIYRNSQSPVHENGIASPGSPGLLLGRNANTYSRFAAHHRAPVEIMRHEFSHLLFGDNNFHYAGGGAGETGRYWISYSGGWGALGLSGCSLQSWSGWDRLQMDWKALGQINPIPAHEETNTSEVNGDLDPTLTGQPEIFVLRDFVSSGDALRIKLPYTNPLTEYPEFIWVENHQGYGANGNLFDRWKFEGDPCIVGVVPGLYMYVQIDKEIRTATSASALYGGGEEFTRPLNANGAFDIVYEAQPQTTSCVSTGDNFPFIYEVPNPLTGFSDTFSSQMDLDGDDAIENYDYRLPVVENEDGVYHTHLFKNGHARQAFTPTGNSKLGIGTNPSSASMMNTLADIGSDVDAPNHKNLRRIYLNGISVELIEQMADGSIKVRVRFDDVDVTNDARWCADEIQLNPVPTVSGHSLNVTTGSTITLDQGRTPTQRDLQQTLDDGTKLFVDPTLMRCIDGTWLNLEPGSGFIVDNKSTLRLETGSRLDIADGAELRVKRGGKLELMTGSTLNIADGGRVVIEEEPVTENDGRLIFHPDARINLDGATAELEIAGILEIKENATFTTGSTSDPDVALGRVRFSDTDIHPWNIIAEANTRFIMRSDHKYRRILQVDQATLYGPPELVEFSLIQGTASLAEDARIVPPVTDDCEIKFIDARVTTPVGATGDHRGIRLNGQAQVVLDGSSFVNGVYGVFGYNSTLGNGLTLTDCDFSHCGKGVLVLDKQVNATNCSFFACETGLHAEQMTLTSTLDHCSATGGGIGVHFQGSTRVLIQDPQFDENEIGLSVFQADATVECGSISNNRDKGIYVAYGGILRMTTVLGDPPHDPVTVVDNPSSIYCKKAFNCYLSTGYNSLRPVVTGIQQSLFGTFMCQTYFTQRAYRNNWNGVPVPPLTSADYAITTACVTPANVLFIDPYSHEETPCGQAIPPCPDPPCPPHDELAHCPSCEFIETEEYGNVRLNVASATAKVIAESNAPGNELEALVGYNEILMADLVSLNASEDWLLKYDYSKMKESFSDAFAKGEVSTDDAIAVIDAYLDLLGEVQNRKIEDAAGPDGYDVRLFTTLDRAGSLRAAKRLDDAVALLDDVVTWTLPGELELVTRLQCLAHIERDIVNGTISWDDFEELESLCPAAGKRLSPPNGAASASTPATASPISLQPNPANDKTLIQGAGGEPYKLELTDIHGRTILTTNFIGSMDLGVGSLNSGIYLCRIFTSTGAVFSERLVIGR